MLPCHDFRLPQNLVVAWHWFMGTWLGWSTSLLAGSNKVSGALRLYCFSVETFFSVLTVILIKFMFFLLFLSQVPWLWHQANHTGKVSKDDDSFSLPDDARFFDRWIRSFSILQITKTHVFSEVLWNQTSLFHLETTTEKHNTFCRHNGQLLSKLKTICSKLLETARNFLIL